LVLTGVERRNGNVTLVLALDLERQHASTHPFVEEGVEKKNEHEYQGKYNTMAEGSCDC
jgi:hypothetical protein